MNLNWPGLPCGVWPFSHSAITGSVLMWLTGLVGGKYVCVLLPREPTALWVFFSPIDQRQLDHVCPQERSQALSTFPESLWTVRGSRLHAQSLVTTSWLFNCSTLVATLGPERKDFEQSHTTSTTFKSSSSEELMHFPEKEFILFELFTFSLCFNHKP